MPPAATVDLDAIACNAAVAAARTRGAVMAVVKADGFGHGAAATARTALAAGAQWLGVASPAEALALRAEGLTAPVLSWLYHPADDLRPSVEAGIDLSVASPPQLAAVASAAAVVGRRARIHLKIDTGLCRGGATVAEWPTLVRLARERERAGSLTVHGLWSHLVDADDPAGAAVPGQVAAFEAACAVAERAGLRPSLRHLANSAAALHRPETHFDLVRFGIGLYGVEPMPATPTGLRPAMTLTAPVVLRKRVPAGSGVSYHHRYVTRRPSTLALVALGYADGVPRSASGRAQVWVDGNRYPVAGRIAMDQFVVDLGDADPGSADPGSADPGSDNPGSDEVVLFGPGDRGEPTVTEWADWAGTIAHEILTGVGGRVVRRWVGASTTTVAATIAEEALGVH